MPVMQIFQPVWMTALIQHKCLHLTGENKNQYIFGCFVNKILHNIEQHPVQGEYDMNKIIIWKHLRAHIIPYVITFIEDRDSPTHFSYIDHPHTVRSWLRYIGKSD